MHLAENDANFKEDLKSQGPFRCEGPSSQGRHSQGAELEHKNNSGDDRNWQWRRPIPSIARPRFLACVGARSVLIEAANLPLSA